MSYHTFFKYVLSHMSRYHVRQSHLKLLIILTNNKWLCRPTSAWPWERIAPAKKRPIWSWRCLTDVNYKGRRAHDTTDVLTTYKRSVHDDKRLSSSGHNFWACPDSWTDVNLLTDVNRWYASRSDVEMMYSRCQSYVTRWLTMICDLKKFHVGPASATSGTGV